MIFEATDSKQRSNFVFIVIISDLISVSILKMLVRISSFILNYNHLEDLGIKEKHKLNLLT